MGEVYIRKQNKETLYRLSDNCDYIKYKESKGLTDDKTKFKKRHIICIATSYDHRQKELGEYESKDRCMEILDEIQRAMLHLSPIRRGSPVYRRNKGTKTVVYQMPER